MDPHISANTSPSTHMNDFSSKGQRKSNAYDDRRPDEAAGAAVGVLKTNTGSSSSLGIGREEDSKSDGPMETLTAIDNDEKAIHRRDDNDGGAGLSFAPLPRDFRRDENDGRGGSSMNPIAVNDLNAMKNFPMNSMGADLLSSNYNDITQGQQVLPTAPGADNRLMNYPAYPASSITGGVEATNTRAALLPRPVTSTSAAGSMPPLLSGYQLPLKEEGRGGDYLQLPPQYHNPHVSLLYIF